MNGTSTNNAIDNAIVTYARVVAHLSQELGGGLSENHWSIYVLLEGGRSIRMNMIAEYGNPTGTIKWTTYEYQLTTSALQHWDYELAGGLTFKNIQDLVVDCGRDRYRFSGGGSGCRYWCYIVIQDLEQHRFIGQGSCAHLWPHLQWLYSRSRGPRELNWVEGEFY